MAIYAMEDDHGDMVNVTAEQWVPGKAVPGVRVYGELAFLDRVEGDVTVSPGDWIVTGPNGARWCVSDPIFNRFYRAA